MTEPGFAERARREAARYGGGPWVFVRELLQNARDAGARRVLFESRCGQERAEVVCRDDGDGMTFDHARRYLFRLYASSKDGRRGQGGRFGVGFWSVLGWAPERIVVRSWPRRGWPWEVELDGELEVRGERRPAPGAHGTEVRLQRGSGAASHELAEAVARYGRHLTRLGAPEQALDVRVDGHSVARPFDLPPPRLRFGGRGLRGVVALQGQPRVELLVRGLPVREAACLQDLLAVEQRPSRPARPEIAGGLAPGALLDSMAVEVLLSRDDVRASQAVAGLVERAERALDHLLERQLDCLRPRTWRERLADVGRSRTASGILAALLALGAGAAWHLLAPSGASAPSLHTRAEPPAAPLAPAELAPYRDLGESYRGAWGDEGQGLPARPVALTYAPAERDLRLAALVVPDPSGPAPPPEAHSDEGWPGCRGDCLSLALLALGRQGLSRLPVPSGEAPDGDSLLVDDRPARLWRSAFGEPLVELGPGLHRVRYRTAPAPWRDVDLPRPRLSAEAAREAARLAGRPPGRRAEEGLAFVRARVRYSTAPAVARAHRQRALLPFDERVLAVGAGDCDVQNGLLAELLRAAGQPARLVVGHLGTGGRALPDLHAWVEWRREDGSTGVLDASLNDGHPSAEAVPRERGAAPEAAPTPRDRAETASPATSDARPVPSAERPPAVLATGLAALLAVALAAGMALLARRWRRSRLELALDRGQSLAALLRGVLENPRAFDHLPALLRRGLLPALRGPRLALGPAWRAALRGRLFVSRCHGALATRAARAGLPVLDGRPEEGRLVAEALGAVDLDEWEGHLEAAQQGPLGPLNRHLSDAGELWRARVLAGLGPSRLLTVRGARVLADERADRLLLVDADDPWLAELAALQAARPARALFVALARLGAQAGLPPDERLELLAGPAERALREAAS